MKTHVKNYMEGRGLSPGEYVECEYCCGCPAVDIHHVEPRSSFGSKRKDEQDSYSNLVALCRECHNLAHTDPTVKPILKRIIKIRK